MKKKSNKNDIIKAISLFTQLGLNMFFCILISFFIGKFIDKILFTSPVFLLIFIFLGIIAAFRNMYYLIKNTYTDKGGES